VLEGDLLRTVRNDSDHSAAARQHTWAGCSVTLTQPYYFVKLQYTAMVGVIKCPGGECDRSHAIVVCVCAGCVVLQPVTFDGIAHRMLEYVLYAWYEHPADMLAPPMVPSPCAPLRAQRLGCRGLGRVQ
jgi:hypothetical protein